MESSASRRRELQIQGPRPAPLKIRKDSHKIKKPPPPQPQPPPQRGPVIIYSVSPKVIHTNPTDFMTLVQRLTGLEGPAAVSPAARVASFERTEIADQDDRMDVDDEAAAERSGPIPGILSPAPSSLPPIPPGFFSPSFGPSLSPAADGGFLYSPGSLFLSTPVSPSPGAFWDLFNQLD